MEDFSNILWLLILVGSAAVSMATKAKEHRRKTASASPPQPKASESVRPGREAAAKFRPNGGNSCKTPSADTKAAADTKAETASADALYRGPLHDSSAGQPERCTESGILSGCDLRKAVVWSEILKPKFGED